MSALCEYCEERAATLTTWDAYSESPARCCEECKPEPPEEDYLWGMGFQSEAQAQARGGVPMIDPTRSELLEFLRSICNVSTEDDEFDIEQAAYHVAADCHSGQFSNLYTALSASPYRPGRMEDGADRSELYSAACAWILGETE